jgi:hypothetical protein
VRRLRWLVAALVALAASGFFAPAAFADTQPDPQLSNIPSLAWRGEEVRLVKCEPDILAGLSDAQRALVAQSAQFSLVFVDFLLVDWSGDPLVVRPQLEPGTVSLFFRSFDSAPCVAGTVVSQKPGLAQFKLVVTANLSLASGGLIGVPEVITIKHDFNVAWMNINQAVVNPLDPTIDAAGGEFNELQVLVNGTIPLLGNYGELGLGDSVTMPDDWAALANAMATFRDPLDPNPAMRWDIHDEFSPAGTSAANPFGDGFFIEGHGGQSACQDFPVATFFDAVDDCDTSQDIPTIDFGIEEFSRVWQGFTNPTLGPFDPQRPSQTLLSNGVLDRGDAPMPAARVDWTIAPNSGAPGDISGVGSLVSDLKALAYARPLIERHPLYAPFYAQWIPPATPSIGFALGVGGPPVWLPEASGITGPANVARGGQCNDLLELMQQPFGPQIGGGNNFNGFLTCGLYADWWFAKALKCGPGGFLNDPNDQTGEFDACFIDTELAPTGCKPVVSDFGAGETGADIPFSLQTAATYTDEHGEARVFFWPGEQFFFLNLPGVSINANGGCDLANIPGGVLGTAALSATARYPFEPVTARPVVSNTITKTVTSAFSKSITCYPKGTQPEEQNAAICVAQAIDITGAPFFEETVCFFADFNAEDIQPFPAANPGVGTVTTATPPFNVAVIADGVTPMADNRNEAAEAAGLRRICMFTDGFGRAAVEIFNTNPTTVDVSALFVDEGILRSIKVPFPITGQVGPATGVRAAASPGASPAANPPTNPTPGARPVVPAAKPPVKLRVARAKLLRHTRTRASVVLRVNGPRGRIAVRIRIGAAGKPSRTVTRVVPTNRLYRVRNLRTPSARRLALKVSLVS